MSSRIKPQNLTPHFRSILREENPTWTEAEVWAFQWKNGPVFKGTPLKVQDIVDSRFPAYSAVERMFYDIRKEVAGLIFNRRAGRTTA